MQRIEKNGLKNENKLKKTIKITKKNPKKCQKKRRNRQKQAGKTFCDFFHKFLLKLKCTRDTKRQHFYTRHATAAAVA